MLKFTKRREVRNGAQWREYVCSFCGGLTWLKLQYKQVPSQCGCLARKASIVKAPSHTHGV